MTTQHFDAPQRGVRCIGRIHAALIPRPEVPDGTSGDAPFYIELAWNWLKNGVYGLEVNGQLMPVDVRVPGYPAFLAAVFTFAETRRARRCWRKLWWTWEHVF